MGQNAFPFRRLTDPFMVPVDTTATRMDLPPDFFKANNPGYGCTAFLVVNPNKFWVRFKGTSALPFAPATATTGWLFPPGFVGVFSTQYPVSFSCLSVEYQGLTPGQGVLEVSYGTGA